MRMRVLGVVLAVLWGCKSEVKPAPPPEAPKVEAAPPAPAPQVVETVDDSLEPDGEPPELAAPTPAADDDELVDTWICAAHKGITFKQDGQFFAELGASQPERIGTWTRDGNIVTIVDPLGQVRFTIGSLVDSEVTFSKIESARPRDYFCETTSEGQVYFGSMRRDRDPHGKLPESLHGKWYNGEGFELKAGGKYTYDGPDCVGGKWKVKEGVLELQDTGCTMGPKKIVEVTYYRLRLEQETLFRDVPPEGPKLTLTKVDW